MKNLIKNKKENKNYETKDKKRNKCNKCQTNQIQKHMIKNILFKKRRMTKKQNYFKP